MSDLPEQWDPESETSRGRVEAEVMRVGNRTELLIADRCVIDAWIQSDLAVEVVR